MDHDVQLSLLHFTQKSIFNYTELSFNKGNKQKWLTFNYFDTVGTPSHKKMDRDKRINTMGFKHWGTPYFNWFTKHMSTCMWEVPWYNSKQDTASWVPVTSVISNKNETLAK